VPAPGPEEDSSGGSGSNSGLTSAWDRSARNGLWKPSDGPPYVPEVILYAGEGTNEGTSDIVRRILGIKTSWRDHEEIGPSFLESFEGDHMRFIARAPNFLVVPSLGSPVEDLSDSAGALLRNFVEEGGGTLVVVGGPLDVSFLNGVLPIFGHDGTLRQLGSGGPYEAQRAILDTPFGDCATMLPGGGVYPIAVSSLPRAATSLYEGPGVSVAFSLPAVKGKIVYIGFNFAQDSAAWESVLRAATGQLAL